MKFYWIKKARGLFRYYFFVGKGEYKPSNTIFITRSGLFEGEAAFYYRAKKEIIDFMETGSPTKPQRQYDAANLAGELNEHFISDVSDEDGLFPRRHTFIESGTYEKHYDTLSRLE